MLIFLFSFFKFCLISPSNVSADIFEQWHFSIKTKHFTVLQLSVRKLPSHPGSASLFQCRYDLIPFTGITKCFLHTRKWCTVAVTFKWIYMFFCFVFFVWCWCKSQNIHLIGWNISLRDPWDLSIYSFVMGLLMLQFEGKQKWKIREAFPCDWHAAHLSTATCFDAHLFFNHY